MESWNHMDTADEVVIEGPSPPCPLLSPYRLGLSKGHLEEAHHDPKGLPAY